jgi:hypothetical protein
MHELHNQDIAKLKLYDMHPNLSCESKYYSKFTSDCYNSDIKQIKKNSKGLGISRPFLQSELAPRNNAKEIMNLKLVSMHQRLYTDYKENVQETIILEAYMECL